MLLGLLSDTHDDIPHTKAAIALLTAQKVDALLHAGDLVAPHMLDLFQNLPLHFVFGNNEYDLPALRAHAHALHLHCHNHFALLTFAHKKIALLHGHDSPLLHRTLTSHSPDYLIHGHTHTRRDDHSGKTRIINPGALHRTRTKSVATLNLLTNTLQFHEIKIENAV